MGEFLVLFGKKIFLENSSFFFTLISNNVFYPPPPPPPRQSGLKLVCNVNIVYGNLKSENSQDYAKKPQRNCTFMNSASALTTLTITISLLRINLCSDQKQSVFHVCSWSEAGSKPISIYNRIIGHTKLKVQIIRV